MRATQGRPGLVASPRRATLVPPHSLRSEAIPFLSPGLVLKLAFLFRPQKCMSNPSPTGEGGAQHRVRGTARRNFRVDYPSLGALPQTFPISSKAPFQSSSTWVLQEVSCSRTCRLHTHSLLRLAYRCRHRPTIPLRAIFDATRRSRFRVVKAV